jgi:hypothetical protein
MKCSTSTSPDSFHEALHGIDRGTSAGSLETWRRLVRGALARAGSPFARDEDRLGDVVGSLFEKLLLLRAHHPQEWGRLLATSEGPLRAELRQMAHTTAMDLDPERDAKRALAQLIGRVLPDLPPTGVSAPSSLLMAGRFSRKAVAEAVAWTLAQPDAPRARPYPLACHLLGLYRPSSSLDERSAQPLADASAGPADLAAESEQAARVAAELDRRLDPDEHRALALQLRGATLDSIAVDLGCKRTRAHTLAHRARQLAANVVARIEAEWQVA